MCWPNTDFRTPIVMVNGESNWHRPIFKLPRKHMSANGFGRFSAKRAISFTVVSSNRCASEKPVVIGLFDLGPESLFSGWPKNATQRITVSLPPLMMPRTPTVPVNNLLAAVDRTNGSQLFSFLTEKNFQIVCAAVLATRPPRTAHPALLK